MHAIVSCDDRRVGHDIFCSLPQYALFDVSFDFGNAFASPLLKLHVAFESRENRIISNTDILYGEALPSMVLQAAVVVGHELQPVTRLLFVLVVRVKLR